MMKFFIIFCGKRKSSNKIRAPNLGKPPRTCSQSFILGTKDNLWPINGIININGSCFTDIQGMIPLIICDSWSCEETNFLCFMLNLFQGHN